MILIVGSSGLLGREVARRLLSRGERLRLLVRSPGKVDDLKQAGAEVVAGDLTDADSLGRACDGVDRVFAAAHSILGTGRNKSEKVDDAGHRSLIDAAKARGVRQFVYTSALGASANHPVDFWRTKYRVENYLMASGLTYTILRPSAFMEWHAHTFNGKSILEQGKTKFIGEGSKLRNFVAVRDVAYFAVLALTKVELENRSLDIGGPNNASNYQVALLYGKLAGIAPTVSRLPAPIARGIGIVLKPFLPGVSRILHIGSLPDEAFDERFDPAPLLQEFPVKLTSLETFVGEQVRLHQKGEPASVDVL